jgi:hypothetical protein
VPITQTNGWAAAWLARSVAPIRSICSPVIDGKPGSDGISPATAVSYGA